MKNQAIKSIKFLWPFSVGIMFFAILMMVTYSQFLLSEQSSDAQAINMAGRQRMLSQKMTKEIMDYLITRDSLILSKVEETAMLFDRSLTTLQNGDIAMGIETPPSSDEISSELIKLKKMWRPFFTSLKVLISKNSEEITSSSELQYIRENNIALLKQANALTSAFTVNAKRKISGFSNFLFVMLSLSLVLFCAVIYSMKFVVKPIEKIVSTALSMARGKYDSMIKPHGPSELKEIAHAFNSLTASISGMLLTSGSQNQIFTNIKSFINKSSGKFLGYGDASKANASDVLALSEQSAGDIEILASSVRDLATAANEIAGSVALTAEKASEAQSQAVMTTETIERLAKSSGQIGDIIQVINNIASQTNLLALNATIEAARAGEAGKGFAVVANEVKELARQTAEATTEITTMIETIQGETKNAVEAVNTISSGIGEVNDLSSTIASATEEQTATVTEINGNIDRTAGAVIEVKDKVQQLSVQTKEFDFICNELQAVDKSLDLIAEDGKLLTDQFRVDAGITSQIMSSAPDLFKIKYAFYQHLQWKNKVVDAILQAKVPEVEVDPDRCGLGRFLRDYKAPDAQIAGVLEKLKPVHNRMHREVVNIGKMCDKGESKQNVMNSFDANIIPLFKEVIENFNRWISMEERRSI